MLNRDEVFETDDDLTQWIERADERHQRMGPSECLCGWRDDVIEAHVGGLFGEPYEGTKLIQNPDPTPWDVHRSRAVLEELPRRLASNTSDPATGLVLSLDDKDRWQDTICTRMRVETEDFLDALMTVVFGSADPRATAANAILQIYPGCSYAEDVRRFIDRSA